MKNFTCFILVIAMIGCSKEKNSGQSISTDYRFEITDSIRVNHLEELTLIDFHDGMFLAKMDFSNYFVFDETGDITSHIELKTDGPSAISMAYSAGFFEGEFTIMDMHKGLIKLSNDGDIINNFPIPEDYLYMHPYNRPAFTLGNKIAYYRPERDLKDWEDQEKFFRKYYKEPLLEIIDPVTKEVELQMELPETSVYKNGEFHFLHHPKIVKNGKHWYLFLMAEMKFYIYKEQDRDLILKKSVTLTPEGQIPFPQVSLKNSAELFLKLEMIIPSMIEQLFVMDDKIVLIYIKGADENIVMNYDRENQDEWRDFFEALPKYAAVFDLDYKLLQDDIELPSGTISTPIVNKEGQIIVHKNQRLLGEEDWNTYYMLKLNDESNSK
ncbi:hypothetical protein [Arthrospiribacter ruber]|uniref:DUF4221 domain-containing protein n=1 Tax=Arthrospiribacter ruber TaxID=2487934 RepID=A0A951IWI2_9BACT|nr:hypothetical protein [Arthrospiribacter ruber]MBW3467026.1 hypothetical protein [Arthrospiribacter ruber]